MPFIYVVFLVVVLGLPCLASADSSGGEVLLLGQTYERSGRIRDDLRGLGVPDSPDLSAGPPQAPQPPAPPSPPVGSFDQPATQGTGRSGLGTQGAVSTGASLPLEGPQRTDAPPFVPGETVERNGKKMRVWSTSGSVGGRDPAPTTEVPPVIVDQRRYETDRR